MTRAQEEDILESPLLHELADDICKTRRLFEDTPYYLIQCSHNLVDNLLPKAMLARHEKMTRDTYYQFAESSERVVVEDIERVELKQKL
jgi:hypothetical protein